MKNLTKLSLLLAFLLPVISYGQKEMASINDYKTFSSSANLEFTEKGTAADLLINANYKVADKDKCKTYKSMRTAGLIMTIAGSAVFAGGIALLITTAFDEDTYDNDDHVEGKVVLGVASIIGGGLTGTAGIPLMIIGGIKSKKYCSEKDKTSMNIGTQRNGVGASLTF